MIPNYIKQYDGFYISYNTKDITLYGSDTTALVIGEGDHFYILNGDHRKQYKGKTLEECKDYFKRNISDINKYSERL